MLIFLEVERVFCTCIVLYGGGGWWGGFVVIFFVYFYHLLQASVETGCDMDCNLCYDLD